MWCGAVARAVPKVPWPDAAPKVHHIQGVPTEWPTVLQALGHSHQYRRRIRLSDVSLDCKGVCVLKSQPADLTSLGLQPILVNAAYRGPSRRCKTQLTVRISGPVFFYGIPRTIRGPMPRVSHYGSRCQVAMKMNAQRTDLGIEGNNRGGDGRLLPGRTVLS
jgi:hypothetical protein